MSQFLSQNYTTNMHIPVLNVVIDLQCCNTVCAPWPAWFSKSPGADRAGNLVEIVLLWLLLLRTTGTPPPFLLDWPALFTQSQSHQFSCIFFPACPNGHHVTFYLAYALSWGLFAEFSGLCDYSHPQIDKTGCEQFILMWITLQLASLAKEDSGICS